MARLKKIIVIHETSKVKDGNTDAAFELQFTKVGNDPDPILPFPDLPHNEREKGRTDKYEFDVFSKDVDSDGKIVMRMTTTSDGWLPKNMWVIGETVDNERLLLGAHPQWPIDGWFDKGSNPAGPREHIIANA